MQRLPHPHLLPHARRAPPLCSAVKGRSVSQSMDMGFHSQIKSVERRTTSSSTSAHLQFLLCSLEQGLPRSSEPPPMAARGAPSSTAQPTSRTPGTDSPSSPLSPGIFGLKNGGDEHGGGAGHRAASPRGGGAAALPASLFLLPTRAAGLPFPPAAPCHPATVEPPRRSPAPPDSLTGGSAGGGDEHGGGAGGGKETERALRWRLTCGPHCHISKTARQNQPMAKIERF